MSRSLAKIKAAGFIVELEGNDLVVSPFSKLTPPQVLLLRSHKAEIIEALQHEQFAKNSQVHDLDDDRHYCRECAKLINGRCIAQQFRPVDTHPRRCIDYKGIRH